MNTFKSLVLDHATARLLNGGPHVTVVVDALGTICGCGAAEDLFQAGQHDLVGRRISGLVVGVLFDGNMPDDATRQLLRHCAAGCWEKFEAIDARGRIFPLEVHVMRRVTCEQDAFVLNLRQPEKASRVC